MALVSPLNLLVCRFLKLVFVFGFLFLFSEIISLPLFDCFITPGSEGCGKISWTETDVKGLAQEMFGNLPMSVHTLVNGDQWKGGNITRLDDPLARASAADVAVNFHLLKPIVEHSPHKVPWNSFHSIVFVGPAGHIMHSTCSHA